MILTIDASVFVAAARPQETHYSVSRQFLQQARSQNATVFCPTLVIPECAAAIVRPTGDMALAEELVALIAGFPGLRLVSLDPPGCAGCYTSPSERRRLGLCCCGEHSQRHIDHLG